MTAYVLLGAIVGFLSVSVTRALYRVEDWFEALPIHWMWWPALGAVVVGVLGYFEPRVLGVGYQNIAQLLNGTLVGRAALILITLKCVAWVIALGSGTAGGTMAPLFTIGGGAGSVLASLTIALFPAIGVDVRIGALVGMAAMFTGASRALLTSVVFAFEATRQPLALLPLLAGCTGAYLISLLRMRDTIMTERLVRRGVPVVTEYAVDYLSQVTARDRASREVVTLAAEQPLELTHAWLEEGGPGTSHQGFPVVNASGSVVGLLTRRDLLAPAVGATVVRDLIHRPLVAAYEGNTLREVADLMVRQRVGRVPIISTDGKRQLVGLLSRSDVLAAHEQRLDARTPAEPTIRLAFPRA
jgi:CBS domain-containing protein